MGHYCRICGRTRANEKFSGKGHKNHVCKDCSGKSQIIAAESNDVMVRDFENQNIDDENDVELPF